jgi:hypothetical protein
MPVISDFLTFEALTITWSANPCEVSKSGNEELVSELSV